MSSADSICGASQACAGVLNYGFPSMGLLLSLLSYMVPLNKVMAMNRLQSLTKTFNPMVYPCTVLVGMAYTSYGIYLKDYFIILANALGASSGLYFMMKTLHLHSPRQRRLAIWSLIAGKCVIDLTAILANLAFPVEGPQIIGYVSVSFMGAYHVAPLMALREVLIKKNSACISQRTAILCLLNAVVWGCYGLVLAQPFIYWPNCFACIVTVAQIVVKLKYKSTKVGLLKKGFGSMPEEGVIQLSSEYPLPIHVPRDTSATGDTLVGSSRGTPSLLTIETFKPPEDRHHIDMDHAQAVIFDTEAVAAGRADQPEVRDGTGLTESATTDNTVSFPPIDSSHSSQANPEYSVEDAPQVFEGTSPQPYAYTDMNMSAHGGFQEDPEPVGPDYTDISSTHLLEPQELPLYEDPEELPTSHNIPPTLEAQPLASTLLGVPLPFGARQRTTTADSEASAAPLLQAPSLTPNRAMSPIGGPPDEWIPYAEDITPSPPKQVKHGQSSTATEAQVCSRHSSSSITRQNASLGSKLNSQLSETFSPSIIPDLGGSPNGSSYVEPPSRIPSVTVSDFHDHEFHVNQASCWSPSAWPATHVLVEGTAGVSHDRHKKTETEPPPISSTNPFATPVARANAAIHSKHLSNYQFSNAEHGTIEVPQSSRGIEHLSNPFLSPIEALAQGRLFPPMNHRNLMESYPPIRSSSKSPA